MFGSPGRQELLTWQRTWYKTAVLDCIISYRCSCYCICRWSLSAKTKKKVLAWMKLSMEWVCMFCFKTRGEGLVCVEVCTKALKMSLLTLSLHSNIWSRQDPNQNRVLACKEKELRNWVLGLTLSSNLTICLQSLEKGRLKAKCKEWLMCCVNRTVPFLLVSGQKLCLAQMTFDQFSCPRLVTG